MATVENWTADDFKAEAARLLEEPLDAPNVLCGAMMLMAIRDGAHLRKLAKGLGVPTRRLSLWFHNLVANGVFCRNGTISANWLSEGGGLAFVMDIAVANGLMAREK